MANLESSRRNFLKWLEEYGNDLYDLYGILSASGSDGPDIKEKGLDTEEGLILWSNAEGLEKYLVDYEYYEKDPGDYNPPSKHYIDWLNDKK